MPARELFVFAHLADGFVPAGRLKLIETAREVTASSFAYGTRYLRRPGRFEIDPTSLAITNLTEGVELFPARGLTQFGGIRDAAPDSWGRRVIEAQRRVPANSLPESEYLLAAGSDRVGALDVRESLSAKENGGAAPERSLRYLLEASERIEAGEPLPARGDATHVTQSTTPLQSDPSFGPRELRLPFVSGLTLIACDEMESPTKSYADLAQAIRTYAHASVIRYSQGGA